MQLLFDLFPVIAFFAVYKFAGIYVATGVLIAVTLAQVGYLWIRERRVSKMHVITAGLVLVFGGATLLLQEEAFVKMKPTVAYWLFAAAFLASRFVGGRPLARRMLEHAIDLETRRWNRLNDAWTAFFLTLGALNLYVAGRFTTDTWVNFKLYGLMGLTLAFVLAQAFWLAAVGAVRETEGDHPDEGG